MPWGAWVILGYQPLTQDPCLAILSHQTLFNEGGGGELGTWLDGSLGMHCNGEVALIGSVQPYEHLVKLLRESC